MLHNHRGHTIKTIQNQATGLYSVSWLNSYSLRAMSAYGFKTREEAVRHAKDILDRDSALTVHKPQRREEDGDCLFAA
jgi:hypothetical protein